MELRIITKDELVEIIRKHALWLVDENEGERADLSFADLSFANLRFANLSSADLSSADLQLVGQDIRGYLFWSFANDDGVVVLRAGCREFIGIAAARAHWTERHGDDVLHADCLSLVDRCEQMAKVRGWKLDVE
jgi:uncharacterized protein YjbI with pentapeptide repeats